MVLALLFLAAAIGCVYKAPLAEKQNLPIDPAVLGAWEESSVSNTVSAGSVPEQMLILKFTDTEYLIHYPTGSKGLYYRGYPIKVGGISCVQLQVVGSAQEPTQEAERLFTVVAYSVATNGELEVRTLNTKILDEKRLETTEELKKAFLAHEKDPDLFANPGVFKKVAVSEKKP